MHFSRVAGALAAALGMVVCGGAAADGFQATEVQALYGDGFELGPRRQGVLTLQHFRTFEGGDLFGFVDAPKAVGSDGDVGGLYGEAYVRLDDSTWSGRDLAIGPVADVGLSVGVNLREQPRVLLAGPSLTLKAPGFDLLQVSAYAYAAEGAPATHQITLTWDAPIELSPAVRLKFRGFADWIGEQGDDAHAQVLAQPQLLLDAGALGGRPDKVFVGAEWRVWRDKYGVAGVDESVLQAMVSVRL